MHKKGREGDKEQYEERESEPAEHESTQNDKDGVESAGVNISVCQASKQAGSCRRHSLQYGHT